MNRNRYVSLPGIAIMDQAVDTITNSVLSSKKYRGIYRPTVARIVQDVIRRYPAKDVEKEVRNKLHQIWGMYLERPNFEKLIQKVRERLDKGESVETALESLLLLQSSTRERIPVIETFYRQIFSVTGVPQRVVDYGCGLNPLTYLWFNCRPQYVGIDVDQGLINFVNQVNELIGLADQIEIKRGDILVDLEGDADVAMLLKVIPILERQQKGSTRQILQDQPCRYWITSFPTKSLSGRSKGMKEHYQQWFLDLIKDQPWEHTQIEFKNELVFIIQK